LAQIDYFKLVKKFPQIVDIEDTIDVKNILIEYVRKKTWRKEGRHSLLPLSSLELSLIALEKYKYEIKYKKEIIFVMRKIPLSRGISEKFLISYNPVWLRNSKNSYFLTSEEIQNLKRIILIDSVL